MPTPTAIPALLALVVGSFDTVLRVSPAHDGFVAVTSDQDFELLGLTSTFSPPPPVDSRILSPLAVARPLAACGPIERVPAGSTVLVARGQCTFDTKVLSVEAVGGAVAVVINTDDAPVHMDIHSDAPRRPTIAALMVNATDGNRLRGLVASRAAVEGQRIPPPGVTFQPLDNDEPEAEATLTEGALILVAVLGLGVGLGSTAAARHAEWALSGLGTRTVLRGLDLLGRALLASTFIEDAARVLMHWGTEVRVLALTFGTSATSLNGIRAVLALSVAVQLPCALAVVLGRGVGPACAMLLAWLCAQPVLYDQKENVDLLISSMAVGGGLLFLLAHNAGTTGPYAGGGKAAPAAPAQSGVLSPRAHNALSVCARLLLVSIFLFQSFEPLHVAITHRRHQSVPFPGLGTAVDGLVLALGGCLCFRVVLGMQSRLSAMPLILTLLLTNIYNYNFWHPHLSSFTMHASGAVQLHEAHAQRFMFFQTLSAIGGLLLVVVHGSGGAPIDGRSQPWRTAQAVQPNASMSPRGSVLPPDAKID